ncbi:MAG: hypothetical protein J1F35_03190 [Erysipelotrichales bacterium]|nr:hypothetical protein [Erysipelotrichales bacterium]
MFITSGIINDGKPIEIDNSKIISYLNILLVDLTEEEQMSFDKLKSSSLIVDEEASLVEYFVKFKNFVIVYDDEVYYSSELDENMIDKVQYIKKGYKLHKMPSMFFENGKNKKKLDPIQMEIERLGAEHSISEENDLSFWYPRTQGIGFKSPKTIITSLTEEETTLCKTGNAEDLDFDSIVSRIYGLNPGLYLYSDLFLRLGITSNKFNFATCHLNNIDELREKLIKYFDDLVFRLEWVTEINLIIREYIKTTYQRPTIYRGMPLNTEFRVFYDFDTQTILGIYNYWDKNTMVDNLRNKDELLTFVSVADEIDSEVSKLKPQLYEEVSKKMPSVTLEGKWSIDFLYDGENFVLIDMAHAECSYYYEKVLRNQTK